MKVSLRWKIAINMWLLAAFCAVAAGFMSGWLLVRNYEVSLEQQLKSVATTLMSMGISDYSGLEDFQKLDSFIEDALKIRKDNQIIHVYTKRGKMMFSSKNAGEENFKSHFKPVKKPAFSVYRGEKKYKVLTTPYAAKNGRGYFLQIAMLLPPYSEVLSATALEAVILLLILSAAVLVISRLLAQKLVSPVRYIADYLNRLDAGDVKGWKPLILTKPGEYLSDIVAGINGLMVSVKRSMYAISRTSRFLAHELRNPLTIMIGESEAVLGKKDAEVGEYRELVKSSLEEVDRMNNVIGTILKIAKRERLVYRPVPCSLNALMADNLKRWGSILGRDVRWECAPENIVGLFDPELMVQMIDNLVRNVREHSGCDVCRIWLKRKDGETLLTVEDDGKGMPAELAEALNGSDTLNEKVGIGLLLCLEIASICRFKITFTNKTGGGLLVTLRLQQKE